MNRLIIDAPGQTCNRFFSYLDSVSWAIINKKKVYVVFWDTSLKYYPRLRNNKFISFPFYNCFLIKLLGEKRYGNIIYRHLPKIKKLFHKCELVKGWDLRECDKYYPQAKIANELFKPQKKIMKEVDSLFKSSREQSGIIVGVHFRKGDYKEWLGGKYYYEDNVYERLMIQIEQLFQEKVKFFVCTNGIISSEIINNNNVFCINKPTVAHDLYALTLCDYIIGPPSTFSGWASLVGNVPLHYIYSPDELLRIEDFSPLISNSYFQNGRWIWDEESTKKSGK